MTPTEMRLKKKIPLCLGIISGRIKRLTLEQTELLDLDEEIMNWELVQELAEEYITSLLEDSI